MKTLFKFKYKEPLGKSECPYAHRTYLIFFGYSIRIHKWYRSDDKRYMHNHPWWFITFVIKGSYKDVSLGLFKDIYQNDYLKRFHIRYRKPNHTHYVEIPKGGCTTILITGRKNKQWGFWVNKRYLRINRYFKRYGHPPCSEQ